VDPTEWLLDQIIHWHPPAEHGFDALCELIEAIDGRAPLVHGMVAEALDRARMPAIRALAEQGLAAWRAFDPEREAAPPMWLPGDPGEPTWAGVFAQITEREHGLALMTLWYVEGGQNLAANGIPIEVCIPYIATTRALASQIAEHLGMDYMDFLPWSAGDAPDDEVTALRERCRAANLMLETIPDDYKVVYIPFSVE
jgi:hypothetical protein